MDSGNEVKVKSRDEVVWRIIDGEVIVLSAEDVSLHCLTGCGSRIWELIQQEATISEIIQNICDEYEVEPQRADEEITGFIQKLVDLKLVEVSVAVK